ncbi:MAG: DUF5337 domain-containing protein [Planktomarina sp.]
MAQEPNSQDKSISRKGQTAGLVIAFSMSFWVLMQWVGPSIGLAGRYALLIDLAVMAAMVWALVVTFQIWRARQDKG